MIRSIYPVFTERRSVSCSLIICSSLVLCSAAGDLSICGSRMSVMFFDSNLSRMAGLSNIMFTIFTTNAVHTRRSQSQNILDRQGSCRFSLVVERHF
jgi:hypothetical protein